jgi:hypothetical protein
MDNKIFVSYKYGDNQVENLSLYGDSTVRDYVDEFERKFDSSDNINKGESDGEDLSKLSDNTIWEKLKDRIYDSSVTIVLISPNMRETGKWQRSQWIPWEIAYSLRETTRNDFTSHSNAILAVILPDSKGRYSYYNKDNLFPILKSNIDNDYIYVVRWDDFLKYTDADINIAISHKEKTPTYKIVKTL